MSKLLILNFHVPSTKLTDNFRPIGSPALTARTTLWAASALPKINVVLNAYFRRKDRARCTLTTKQQTVLVPGRVGKGAAL